MSSEKQDYNEAVALIDEAFKDNFESEKKQVERVTEKVKSEVEKRKSVKKKETARQSGMSFGQALLRLVVLILIGLSVITVAGICIYLAVIMIDNFETRETVEEVIFSMR